ncbi:MAG TPA: hypothetical protein VFZ32_19010 [Micromonosporaceae bacterium]
MWALYEPVHSVSYFTPEAREAFETAGLRGYWRGYFAGRAAPLGPVAVAPVVAAFFNFAPDMVARALPDVWQRATPEQALRARSEGATAALARLTADLPAASLAEAADLLTEAASRLDHAGRVLGAGNAALPVPEKPLPRLWQAATTLREHRGDGHVAALVTAGLDGCEALAWRTAYDLSRELLQPNRGWTDEEWDAATRRLVDTGWLDSAGKPTQAGLARHQEIEAATDRAATAAWTGFDTERLGTLLAPVARACRDAIPGLNPIGLPPHPGDQDG